MRIMANFFSLASATERETNPLLDNFNTNNSGSWNNNNSTSASGNGLILYRNEEIYNQKSLEIWNQSCLQFHPRFIHHHHYSSSSSSPAMMGPMSTGSMMRSARGGLVTSGGMNCQDCGNQAKKDCAHLRCRSCCKTRGFECSTHVRSTWVPAAKRRERQQRQQQQQQRPQESQQLNESEKNGGGESDNQMISQKRQREKDYLACDNTTSTGLELGQQFPAELHSPAMFRCVRVQSNDDTDEQLAYQTTVNIGGHLFKGILYDQGPETRQFPTPPGSKDSSANLMIAAANQPDNPVAGASLLETNALYSPPISAFLAGTQFYSTPRS